MCNIGGVITGNMKMDQSDCCKYNSLMPALQCNFGACSRFLDNQSDASHVTSTHECGSHLLCKLLSQTLRQARQTVSLKLCPEPYHPYSCSNLLYIAIYSLCIIIANVAEDIIAVNSPESYRVMDKGCSSNILGNMH